MSSSPLHHLGDSTRDGLTPGAASGHAALRPSGVASASPTLHGSSRPTGVRADEPQPKAGREAAFELITRSPTETVAIVDDCLLVVVGHTLGAGGVRAIQRGFERLEQAYGRFGYITVIDAHRVNRVEQRVRDRMAELVGRYTRHIIAACCVVEGVGFPATAVRSLLTAIHIASRASHPLKVFTRLDATLDWYARKHPEGRCDKAMLGLVVERLGPPPA